MIFPADTYRDELYTTDEFGEIRTADSVDAAVLVVDGVDTAVVVTVDTATTGVLKVSAPLSTVAVNSVVWIRVTATVDSLQQTIRTEQARVGYHLETRDAGEDSVLRRGADAVTGTTLDTKIDTRLPQAVVDVQAALAAATLLGEVVADAGNSTTQFKSDVTGETNNFVQYGWILFYSGDLLQQAQPVATYDGTTGIFTVAAAFTGIPAAGATFAVIGRS